MKLIWTIRHNIARHLIHLGLWIMPDGRAKRELMDILWDWGRHVENTVKEYRSRLPR